MTDPGAELFESLRLFAIDHFLTADECAFIRELMRGAPAGGATVARGSTGEYRLDEAFRQIGRASCRERV